MRLSPLLGQLVTALLLAACAAGGPALNSDRIERQFGSYGVEILSADETGRVSSLYSDSEAGRITRTYAVVEFLGGVRPEFHAEHEAILQGGSIGATFRGAGWIIRKQNLFIGELEVPATFAAIADRMNISLPETLAVHEYLFVVSDETRSFSYARIVEVHHPAFLDAAALRDIYGEIVFDDSNRDRIHDFIGPPPGK